MMQAISIYYSKKNINLSSFPHLRGCSCSPTLSFLCTFGNLLSPNRSLSFNSPTYFLDQIPKGNSPGDDDDYLEDDEMFKY